jgi:hypothetical protein
MSTFICLCPYISIIVNGLGFLARSLSRILNYTWAVKIMYFAA